MSTARAHFISTLGALGAIACTVCGVAIAACGTSDFRTPSSGGGDGGGDDGSTSDGSSESDDGSVTGDGSGGDGAPVDDYRRAVLDDQPLGYWSFDTAPAGLVEDRSGHGHAVRLSDAGAALVALDVLSGGMAARFDGGYAVAIDPDGGLFAFDEKLPFSIEAWIAPDRLEAGVLQRIVSKDSLDETQLYHDGYDLHVTRSDAGDGISVVRWTGGASPVEYAAASSAPIGVFTHVVSTYDGQTLRLFVNGTKLAESASGKSIYGVGSAMTIGARSGDFGASFSGVIDEVALYDHPLPQDRVLKHYQAARR